MYKCKLCGRYVEDLTEDLASRIFKHLEEHKEYKDHKDVYDDLDTDAITEEFFEFVPNSCSLSYDANNNPIIVISDVRFGGRNIDWNEIKEYLMEYIDSSYEVIETTDVIYIGSDFPKELKGSEDTVRLKGANVKAKANATQEIPALLSFANNKRWQENFKSKHKVDAKHGWYRFTTRFALPVYLENGEIERFNIFRIEMLVRHASDNRLYLYDMVNVKKEMSNPLEP
ncbi:MAG: hypothetical protein Q4E57_08005 [Eubacteriales bacterium]|nr:hypothetical protein [Eubacteriales bacterium]